MYLEHLHLKNLRTYVDGKFELLHADRRFPVVDASVTSVPSPKLRNVNLLLGGNGSGKSTFLRGAALAMLGPAVKVSSLPSYQNVRRDPSIDPSDPAFFRRAAQIGGRLQLHAQDGGTGKLTSHVHVERTGDAEGYGYGKHAEPKWNPIFVSDSNAFFFVAYGSTRRSERRERFDAGGRNQSAFVRAQRTMGLFDESHSLVPLSAWLPTVAVAAPVRFGEIVCLIDRVLPEGSFRFAGDYDSKEQEYVFVLDGFRIPYPALSDGYRAFLGWFLDLIYHLHTTTPIPASLTEVRGVAMVDEVDLHLHPDWQRQIVAALARALPNIQFILTTHSPLVVGSLEWMNVLRLELAPTLVTLVRRIDEPIHGLGCVFKPT